MLSKLVFLPVLIVDLRNKKSGFPEFELILLKNILEDVNCRFRCMEAKSYTMKRMATPIRMNNNMYLFLSASVYLMIFITTSLMNKIVSMSGNMTLILNTLTSVLQAPMILIMMLSISTEISWRKMIKKLLGILLGCSIVAIASMGLQEKTLFYITISGQLPAFILGAVLFIQLLKHQHSKTNKGEVLLLSGTLFTSSASIIFLGLHITDPLMYGQDIRHILGLITLIASIPVSVGLFMTYHISIPALEPADTFSPTKAGKAQWENFSLSNTPDVFKTSVTDISKYYAEVE